jgi:hypothetical protein
MKILSERKHETVVSFSRWFEDADCPGSGFRFPCDAQGALKKQEHSYEACLSDSIAGRRMLDRGIVRSEHTYVSPAVGKCNCCGSKVELAGFTNTCDCGADYNMSGQELAPRAQWGEETGESLAEILRIE